MIDIEITCPKCETKFIMKVYKLGVFFRCPCVNPECEYNIQIKEVKPCQ